MCWRKKRTCSSGPYRVGKVPILPHVFEVFSMLGVKKGGGSRLVEWALCTFSRTKGPMDIHRDVGCCKRTGTM